jgi:hypothetical protein
MTKIEDTSQVELEAARDRLAAERQHLRRGGWVGTRLHGHQNVEETFRVLDAAIREVDGEIRHNLARTSGGLPMSLVAQLAALRAAKADEGLREHLHGLVARAPARGEADVFHRDTQDKAADLWPVRSEAEISADLAPIAAELARREKIAADEAELEQLESRRTGLLERLGVGR